MNKRTKLIFKGKSKNQKVRERSVMPKVLGQNRFLLSEGQFRRLLSYRFYWTEVIYNGQAYTDSTVVAVDDGYELFLKL